MSVEYYTKMEDSMEWHSSLFLSGISYGGYGTSGNNGAWVGIGWGSSMTDTDAVICQFTMKNNA